MQAWKRYCKMSDLEFLKQVNETIEANKEDMISSLSHLLQIPSVAVETGGEHPFGEEVQKAYDAMLEMDIWTWSRRGTAGASILTAAR